MSDDQGSEPDRVTEPQRADRTVTGPDWIIPILSAGFASYYLWSIAEMRWEAKINSFFVALILCALIVAFAIRTARGLAQGRLRIDFGGWRGNTGALYRQGLLLVSIVGFIALIPYLGFTITVFAFLLVAFVGIARMAIWRAVLAAGIVAVIGYLLFIVALRTNFPDGPFERLVGASTGLG